VNVTLSKRGGYAARAAICLARAYDGGRPKKLREISAEMGIPRTFVSQILGDLVHAGIALSVFGRDGGHRLTRSPKEITVAEVIEASEGPLAATRCALGDGPCRWQAVCPLHETMTVATASLREVLATTTLALLAERDAAIEAGTYPVPADAHPHAGAIAVSDSVQVELPVASVASRLTTGGSWLTRQGENCDDGEFTVRNAPQRPGWLGKTMAVNLGEPAAADGSLVVPLIWEVSGPRGLFPRFEGTLKLTSLDPERSELTMSGRYRATLGMPSPALDDSALPRLSRATLRSFLRRVARELEETATHPPRSSRPAPRGRGRAG
jgi:Rrf2 family iron-sulfur cluster assembly transcriptional regulator